MNSTVYNYLVDIFKHVTWEQSIRWLPNYKQNVNSTIRQVEDQKVEIKSLKKVLVVGYKVTKQVEIEWLPIFVFHGFLDYWPHGISCYARYHLRLVRLLLNSTTEFFLTRNNKDGKVLMIMNRINRFLCP